MHDIVTSPIPTAIQIAVHRTHQITTFSSRSSMHDPTNYFQGTMQEVTPCWMSLNFEREEGAVETREVLRAHSISRKEMAGPGVTPSPEGLRALVLKDLLQPRPCQRGLSSHVSIAVLFKFKSPSS